MWEPGLWSLHTARPASIHSWAPFPGCTHRDSHHQWLAPDWGTLPYGGGATRWTLAGAQMPAPSESFVHIFYCQPHSSVSMGTAEFPPHPHGHSLSKKTLDFQCPGPGARTSSTGFPQHHAEHENPVPFAPAEMEKLTSFTSHATRMTATQRWIKHDCFA